MAAITTIEEKRVRIDEQQDQIHKCVYLSVKHSVLIKKKKKNLKLTRETVLFPCGFQYITKGKTFKAHKH